MKEQLKASIHQLKDILHHNHWLIWVIILLSVWEGIWKLTGMWKAARSNQPGWFIALAIFNTIGILPIIYVLLINKKSSIIIK